MKKIYSLLHKSFSQATFFLNIFNKRNFYFKKLIPVFFGCLLLTGMSNKVYADVTLTTSPLAAGNIPQGTIAGAVYIVKIDVTTLPVTVSSLQFVLDGTYDNNDLPFVKLYFNATAPSLTGATNVTNQSGLFAAPHTFTLNLGQIIAAGSSGYFIIAVNAAAGATNGNTVNINGAAHPVMFGFTSSPVVTNNQTNAAGTQTIQAADVTLTSSPMAAGNIAQGTSANAVYIVKMDVATLPVTVSSLQFVLDGTYDNDDLPFVKLYFNATAPSLTGATNITNQSGLFAAPHTFTLNLGQVMAAGSSGYFIIAVSTAAGATNGNTVKVDGAAHPVFGFATSPTITDNQTNAAGIQTIQAAGVTLTTSPLAAGGISQGTSANAGYIVKMDVTGLPVTVSSLQFVLDGTYDNDDLPFVKLYFNATAPSLTGATNITNQSGLFAAPHTFTLNLGQAIAAGSSGYFIIAVSTAAGATNGHTVKVDGAAHPVFGFATSPTITDNQTDVAGIQTIQAPGVTLTTSTLAAGSIAQGTSANVIYIVKMDVTGLPVTVSSLQFLLDGTYDNDDLPFVKLYFNATAPSLTGATNITNQSGLFAGPHTFTLNLGQAIAAGSSGYFIIAVSTAVGATNGNTVKVDGAAHPVFGFATSPTITDNQTNAAGIQTIKAANVMLTTSTLAAGNIAQGASARAIYIVKMDVTVFPVTVSSLQLLLDGTYDNNDLPFVKLYFNATAPSLTGATNITNQSGLFAGPHTFTLNLGQAMAAGASGYFIIAVSTAVAATPGNTLKIDGNANPVIFGFSTSPIITNNQTNAAGTQTITGILPVTLISFSVKNIQNKVQLSWSTASELNNSFFEIERSGNGSNFEKLTKINGNGTSALTHDYNYVDESPAYGVNYYRLKQIDIDGHFTYSEVVKVLFAVSEIMISNVYPNPAKDMVNYTIFSPEKKEVLLQVADNSGRVLINKTIAIGKGINKLQLNVSRFASGNYRINIIDRNTNKISGKQIIISKQ